MYSPLQSAAWKREGAGKGWGRGREGVVKGQRRGGEGVGKGRGVGSNGGRGCE